MKALAHWHGTRRWLGVVLPLFTVAFCAPAARASCGHYVVVGAQHDSAAVPHVMSTAGKPLPLPAPVDRSRPCSGPSCSRGPVHAPLTTPARERVLAEQCVCVTPEGPVPGSGPSSSLSGDSPHQLVRPSRRIYHPPR
jgi:hypothetical protein